MMKLQLNRKLFHLNTKKNKKDDVELLKDLALLLGRTHSLNEAMLLLENRYDIDQLRIRILNGESFCQSLKELNFSSDIRLIIKINESNGQLLNGINEAITMIEIKKNNRDQLIKQIRYPLFLLVIVILVIMFVNKLVLPQILDLYTSFDVKLPLLIKVFLSCLKIFPKLALMLLLFICSTMFILKLLTFEEKVKYLNRIPFVAKEYKKIYNTLFMSYIMNLLKSKITLDKALEILSEQEDHKLLKHEVIRIKKELDNGEMFTDTLTNKLYLKSTVEIFNIGINQDNLVMCLESHLIKINAKQKQKNQRVLFLIQPIIYLIIGFIIIIVYGLIFNICYGLIN